MKENFLVKFEVTIPYFLGILFFFTVKQQIPSFIYFILTILLGLYFFPVRFFISSNIDVNIIKNKLPFLFSCFILSVILCFSIIFVFTDFKLLRNLMVVFSILNFSIMIYYYLMDKRSRIFIVHLGFLFLSSAILAL